MSFVFLLGWVKSFVHDKIRPLIIETILKLPENLVQSTYPLGKKLVGLCQFVNMQPAEENSSYTTSDLTVLLYQV